MMAALGGGPEAPQGGGQVMAQVRNPAKSLGALVGK